MPPPPPRSYEERKRGEFFDDVMKIYTYRNPLGNAHTNFVREQYIQDADYLTRDTRVITNFEDGHVWTTEEKQRLKDSCFHRYPVYYGCLMEHMYNKKKVNDLFGYDPVTDPKKVDPSLRYAIVGQAAVKTESNPPSISYIYVVHTWGVNLEESTTDDYRTFVDSQGNIKMDLYSRQLYDMFTLCFKGASYAAKKTGRRAFLRIPLIGMGQFLSAVDYQNKQLAISAFLDNIERVSNKFPDVRANIEDFGSIITPGAYFITGTLFVNSGGDLFDKSVPEDVSSVGPYVTVLVNAWDPKSFIGNGLAQDSTIDGFMTSATGPGKSIPNTSFLHNLFFCSKDTKVFPWE
jgi:hypothetical protein